MMETVEERFWSRVAVADGDACWLWQGAERQKGRGYGIFSIGYRSLVASRVSYELTYGPIPEGQYVLHRCDNPRCVRPEHLFVGTQSDNIRDMDRKGRRPKVDRDHRGERNPSARLTAESVRTIRERVAEGTSYAELALELGVHRSTVRLAALGQTWKAA